jgi:hypothetical protein
MYKKAHTQEEMCTGLLVVDAMLATQTMCQKVAAWKRMKKCTCTGSSNTVLIE